MRAAGFAIAIVAIALTGPLTFPTAAALLTAVAAFAAAERLDRAPVQPLPEQLSIGLPRRALAALSAGGVGCVVAAVAVATEQSLTWQHAPWGIALACFAAAAAMTSEPAAPRMSNRERTLLIALLGACALAFGWRLGTMPPEVHGDEAEVALDALRLLEGPAHSLFSTGWFGLPMFHAAPSAAGLLLFGNDLLGLRLTSAILATGTVLLLFAAVRRMAGTPIALIAALLLAGQRYFIHLARSGYHYVDTPFLSVLVLWLALRLWQDRRLSSAIWCGVVLGLGVQTYYASRIVPILLALTTVVLAISSRTRARGQWLRELILVAAVAVAVAAPLFAHFIDHTGELWSRTQETSIFNPESRQHLASGHGTDSLLELLRIQTVDALATFHFSVDSSVQYGFKAPMIDAVSGVLFLAGLGSALARPTHILSIVGILWIILPLMLGGAMTIDTPFFPRLSGIVPFACILTAWGAAIAGQTAAALVGARHRNRSAAMVATALLAAVVAINASSYFQTYAPHHRHSPMREIGEWIVAQGRGVKTYMIDLNRVTSIYHGTISFIAGAHAREDVDDLSAFLHGPPVDRQRSRFLLMRNNEGALPHLERRYGPLESETRRDIYGRVLFHAVRPMGSSPPTSPADIRIYSPRSIPWVALSLLVGLTAAAAARRQRRRGVHASAPPIPDLLCDTVAAEPAQAPGEPRIPKWAAAAALIAIVAVASGLRFHQLESLPAGFYCDEAGNLYNSASILRTGRDETGALLPLYIWSFDTSYKNPVFIYASSLAVAVFGPTPFAARATAAAFGVAAVVAIFFVGRALFGTFAGLVAAGLLAVLPWHIHFSRIAFELIAFPTLFLGGAYFLIRFANRGSGLSWAAVLLGLSLYTYVPAKLFVPLFVAAFVAIYWRELWQRRRQTVIAGALLAAVTAPVAVFDLTNDDRASRYFRDTSFLSDDLSVGEIAARLGRNYSLFFSPEFFFERGDRILRHAVRNHGELYSAIGPLLLIGVIAIVRSRSRKATLVLVWLALYPLAASFIRREIPSASRAIIGAPAFCLLAAAGADWLRRQTASLGSTRLRPGVLQATAAAAFAIVLAAQTARYWTMYAEDYAEYAAKYFIGFQYGHEQVVDYFLEHYDDYDRLWLTTSLSNQPEIFLRLFAGLRNPPEEPPPLFEPPPKIDRGTPEELHLYEAPRILFAVVPRDLLYFDDYTIVDEIPAPDGSVAFLMTEVRARKDFVHVWMVSGPYPAAATPPTPPSFDPASVVADGDGRERYQLRKSAVYLDHLFGHDTDDACAWAINFVYSSEPRSLRVFAGFDDDGEIWINGARIPLIDQDNPFNTWIDTSNGTADLVAGRNEIAVKTCDLGGSWSFYFRFGDKDGHNVSGLEWEYGFEEAY